MVDDYDGQKYYTTNSSWAWTQLTRLIKEQWQWENYTGGEESESDASVNSFLLPSTDIVFCSFATIMNHQLTGFRRVNFCSKTSRGLRRINQKHRRRLTLAYRLRRETEKPIITLLTNQQTMQTSLRFKTFFISALNCCMHFALSALIIRRASYF